MGINGSTFGNHLRAGSAAAQSNASNSNTNANKLKPAATYWLNVGYTSEVDVDSDNGPKTETRFISLASGIPLDTLDDLPTNGSNELFRKMQAARNDLRDQLVEVAKSMAPGEERILGGTGCDLQLQLRRVNDAKPDIKPTENPFTKRLSFAA